MYNGFIPVSENLPKKKDLHKRIQVKPNHRNRKLEILFCFKTNNVGAKPH